MSLIAFPLLLIPFAFFNIVVFLLNMPLSDEEKSAVFELPLVSEPTLPLVFDHSMPVTLGDFIAAGGVADLVPARGARLCRLHHRPLGSHGAAEGRVRTRAAGAAAVAGGERSLVGVAIAFATRRSRRRSPPPRCRRPPPPRRYRRYRRIRPPRRRAHRPCRG